MASEAASGLQFDGIGKHFGGTYALRDVSLSVGRSVGRGEIVALLGENGAGKSTLIKVLGGIHSADGGQVRIDGVPYHLRPETGILQEVSRESVHIYTDLQPSRIRWPDALPARFPAHRSRTRDRKLRRIL